LQFDWKITNHKNHCYVNKLNWKCFRPIVDIDLPELPDFLRPDPSTTGRPLTPIQDIDLPDGFEVVMEGDHELTEQEISKQEETSGNTFKHKVFGHVFSFIQIGDSILNRKVLDEKYERKSTSIRKSTKSVKGWRWGVGAKSTIRGETNLC
jgi:hypothetical protein